MAAKKRIPSQIAKDQELIADMYLRGCPLSKIIEYLTEENGIQYSADMINRDLRVMRDRWRTSALSKFDDVKQEQLAKLDLMEAKTWEQWIRSCADYEKNTSISSAQGSSDKVETGAQTGDPRYMTVLLSIIDRRCKILGIDAPQKIAPTNPEGDQPYASPTSAEAQKRITELLDKMNFKHECSSDK